MFLEESKNLINIVDIKHKFWEMFIIDSIIGNTDRHNGNWGFLLNNETGEIKFSPIYDCGSCLNPMIEDIELEKINEVELKNLALNCYSCLKEDGKKINYMSYITEMKNQECNEALCRIFNNIKINEIDTFINEIEYISNIRKEFYKNIIYKRYAIIKNVYENLIK